MLTYLLLRLVRYPYTAKHLTDTVSANNLFTAERKCPSCQEPLLRPDDVVLANLDPTECVTL